MSEDKISFASYTLSGLFCDLQARHPEILDELANEFKDSFALLPCGTTQSEKTYFAERFGTRCDKAVAEIQTDPNFPIPPIMAALCRQKFMSYYTLKTVESTLNQIRRRRARGTVGLCPSSPWTNGTEPPCSSPRLFPRSRTNRAAA